MNSANDTANLLFVLLRRSDQNKVIVRSDTLKWLTGRRILRTSFILELNEILVDKYGWTLIELDSVKFSAIKINLLKYAETNDLQINFDSVEKTAESISEILEQRNIDRTILNTGNLAISNFSRNFQTAFFLHLNELLVNKCQLVLVEIERGKFCVTRKSALYKAKTVYVQSFFSASEIRSIINEVNYDSDIWTENMAGTYEIPAIY